MQAKNSWIVSILWLTVSLSCFCQVGNKAIELKVMSYNIRLDMASDGENRWDARKDRVAGLMKYNQPDFIGGQEVQNHQLTYLLEELPAYKHIGVGRDDGKTGGEYSPIFYQKDVYKVLKKNTFWLSPTPDTVSKGWDAACNRVCSWGLFQHIKTGKRIWVFNTHFDHVGPSARLESAKLILRKIKELNTQNEPFVVIGDFNSKPQEPAVQQLVSSLKDCRDISPVVFGNADTWNAFQFHEKPNGCIDHIFIPPGNKLKVNRFATLTDSYDLKYPSDHFPIVAHLVLN